MISPNAAAVVRQNARMVSEPPGIQEFLDPAYARDKFIKGARKYIDAIREWLMNDNPHWRGRRVVRRYTQCFDQLMAMAYEHVAGEWQKAHDTPVPRIALLALGGYGRNELCLGSDIDVMVLMDEHNPEQEEIVKSLMHLLIDFRLDLGYSTRTVADGVKLVGIDLDSTTSMCESRLLAGNRVLHQKLNEEIKSLVMGRHRRWFMRATYRGWQERRQKYEQTVYLLEPNIKESAGGLRDVHVVRWLVFAMTGSNELSQLKSIARFEDDDLRPYRDAIAMLQTARNEIHRLSNGKLDQLVFTHQPEIAARLGYKAQEHRSAEEVFMADYYRNARVVARYSERAIQIIASRESTLVDGLVRTLRRRRLDKFLILQDDVIFIDGRHANYFAKDHDRILALFERVWRWRYRVSERTKDMLARVAPELDDSFAENKKNHERFLRVMHGPNHVSQTLFDMHDCNILGKLIPEFARLHHMVRIDHYHHFTVDHHTLRAVDEAARLHEEPLDKRTFEGNVARAIKRWDLLNMALLLHDIGKGYGSGHALRGGKIAARVCERFGMPPEDIDIVRFLVLSHLKLNHTAFRRDFNDPEVIRQLAEEVGSKSRLHMLFIHTICDLKAVSSDSWNDWRRQMLTDCYRATLNWMEGHKDRIPRPLPNLDAMHDKIVAEVRSYLKPNPEFKPSERDWETQLRGFLKSAESRYLQDATARTMARHYLLRHTLTEDNRIAWDLDHNDQTGYDELLVCAPDDTGLFNKICGALMAKNINILSARISSTADGYALNTFQLTDGDGQPLPNGLRIERLRMDLNQVLLGKKTMEELIEKHRTRMTSPPKKLAPYPTSVTFDNDSSHRCTVIEVRTSDRPGVLYRITSGLQQCRLDIQRAMIGSEAYGICDVFYVTDLEYNKIHDEKTCIKIEQAVLDALNEG